MTRKMIGFHNWIGIAGVVLLLGVRTAAGEPAAVRTVATPTTATLASRGVTLTPRQMLERWGVEVVALRRTAGGYLLDFRYRVKDPAKAKPLFDTRVPPTALEQRSGARFIVPAPPKLGPLRPTKNIQTDKIYFILFANPDRFVKPGDQVTVTIGGFQAKDLRVQ